MFQFHSQAHTHTLTDTKKASKKFEFEIGMICYKLLLMT